ncbi:hypothetical protein [Psychromicrobium lacuslunae]|uniref:Uncharacterized protein n=1 Tax=Psychromicrobium lacuslunae TaxID=1618207 RepID=A0A0D4BZZ2_9MICC|nr:hypothetical protein [Psychromicrobium lacuslunae]AJT41889.1 hypothetical protein UM93_10860 [Psychromicrobium lacuslunae]
MSNSNYPPQGPYPGPQGGYPQGKPVKVPPPIPLPGGTNPEYGVPTPPAYPEQGSQPYGQSYGSGNYSEQNYQQYQGQQYGGGQYQGGGFPPNPPKKNFPLWGWFVLGVPLLGVIAVVIALVAINMPQTPVSAPSPTAPQQQTNSPAQQSSTASSSPTPVGVTPSQIPSSGLGANGAVGLTSAAPYLNSASWSDQVPAGWKADTSATSGSLYVNADGCRLSLASSAVKSNALGATSKNSDLLISIYQSVTMQGSLKDKYPDLATISMHSRATVSMNKLGGPQLEFYQKAFTYTNSSGVKVRHQYVVRAMPVNKTVLVASIACKASTPAGADGWHGVLDNIYTTGS